MKVDRPHPSQPIHAFAIHAPARAAELGSDVPIPVARMPLHQRHYPLHRPTGDLSSTRPIALRWSRLLEHPIHPSFADLQAPPHANDGLPSAHRTRQFPFKASLIALSSSASASSFFRRLFSSSSSLRRWLPRPSCRHTGTGSGGTFARSMPGTPRRSSGQPPA